MSQQGIITDNSSPDPDIETITGTSGGVVGPDGSFNVNLVGDGSIVTVTGDPPTNTLTITVDQSVATTYTGDSGSATPSSNNLNVFGDATQGLSTSGSGATLTLTNADATTSQKGVLETSTNAESIAGTSTTVAVTPGSLSAKLGTQTAFGMAFGNGTTSALSWTASGTDGQLIIAATGADPAFASLTSSDSSITITEGANSLDITTGSVVVLQVDTNSGSAIPAAGVLQILGGTLLGTTGAANTVTVNANDNVVGTVGTDSGTVTPSSNNFDIVGSTGIATSGATDTVTITLDGAVAQSFPTDSGTATPSVGALTIAGSAGIATSGASSTVTISSILTVTSLDDGDDPYTILTSDYYLSCDISAGDLTVDLPDSPTTGSVWIVKDSTGSATANTLSVTTAGGAVTIDGATTFTFFANYQATSFIFNGTSYEAF